MTNEDNRTPGRRSRTNNDETAATRRSAAAKTTRAASRVRATRVLQPIRTLPRQNTRSTKDEIYNTKMMGALKKDGVPTYKVKVQQQGRENLWRTKEKRNEPEYKRQLQRMVRGAPHLPTSPELRLVIKLRPILKPVKEPELNQRTRMLLAIRNNRRKIETETPKQPTSTQENAFLQNKNALLQNNIKPAPNDVPPSAKESQKVLVPSDKESQKVSVFDSDKGLENKIGGCLLAPIDLEPSFEKEAAVSIMKGCKTPETAQEFEVMLQRAHEEAAKLDDMLEEQIFQDPEQDVNDETATAIESVPDDDTLFTLLNDLERELQELIAAEAKATNEISKGSGHKNTPDKLPKLSSNMVTPEATNNPIKLSTDFSSKSVAVTPTKTASKTSTNKATVFTTKTNSTITKPPKNPPDPKFNNHVGVQRVAGGAADVKPGPTRNKEKWKGVTPVQRVSGAPNIEPPKKPPDPKYNKHTGVKRGARGAADIRPGQQRKKIKWKGAALAQRVPGRESHDKQNDLARVQRVPGWKQRGRDHNDPREGVLDTLQVSMHPNVGPDTGGTRTIMVPVIGY